MKFLFATLAIVALSLGTLRPIYAYAAFEEIIPAVSEWRRVPVDGAVLAYRVRPVGVDRVDIDVRNSSRDQVRLTLRLNAHQLADTPDVALSAPAGGTATATVRVRRLDRDIFAAPLTVSAATAIGADGGSRPLTARSTSRPGRAAGLSATTALCLVESPLFNTDRLVVAAQPLETDRLDIHILNRSRETIHCDFRVPGYQPADVSNPRLHLLPGCAQEVVVEAVDLDELATLALVQIWNIRVGEDTGPAIAPGRDDVARLPDLPEGWFPLATTDEGIAGWNPANVAWRLIDLGAGRGAVMLRNQTALPLSLTVALSGGQPQPVQVAAHAETSVVLPGTVAAAAVTAHSVAIDGRPLAIPPAATALVAPEHSMPVSARGDAGPLNPRGVVYTIARAGADRATVTAVNLTAAAVHAEWAISGYQKGLPANSRMHLPAGGTLTLTVPVSHSDPRLAIARLEVWDARVGEDGP